MINYDLEKIKEEIKYKKKKNGKKMVFNNKFYSFLNRLLVTCLITVSVMIVLKRYPHLKQSFYNNVYEINFNFAGINDLYQKYFGGTLPFSDLIDNNVNMVFSEQLEYSDSSGYLDGVKLSVGSNYLVPLLESGLVIFVGDKEQYGNTVIIQQVDGTDVWYSNISNINVKLYDYVSKGDLIGECNNDLYLVFKKDGNVLDYQEYI